MRRDPDPAVHRWLSAPTGSGGSGPSSPLVVTLTRYEEEVLLLVAGEVDHFSAPVLAGRLEEALAPGVERGVIDISGMPFVDWMGLGVFVHATTRFRSRGGDLVLVGARTPFVQLVGLLGLRSSLTLGSGAGAPNC